MPLTKQAKQEAVASLTSLFQEAGAYFITDYQGLNVADMTELRKELRDNKVTYLVAKNSLIMLAAKEAGVSGFDEQLEGPTAIAFALDDPAAAAKILHESFKKRELPRMKAFVVEGEVHSADDIKRLADLPSREVLLSQVVAAVESPFTELVGSIDGFFRELVGSIDALAEKVKTEG